MKEIYGHHHEGTQVGTTLSLLQLNWLDHLVDADIERLKSNGQSED
jgi:hypothetical protein